MLLAVMAMVVIGGAGWYFAKRHEAAARSTAAAELTSIADLKANLLESWIKGRQGDAAVVRSSAQVLQFLAHPDDPTRQAAVEECFRGLKQAYDYDVIALFDPHGALLLATSTNRLQQHSCVSNHVASALAARDVVVTDLHRGEQNERIHLSFLSQIQLTPQTNGPADGLILLMVDPARFLYPFLEKWPVPSPTSETLLVRREGDEALYLNETRDRQGLAPNLRVPLTRTEVPAVRAVLGDRGLMAGFSSRGVPVLAVARAIEETSWLLVAQVDQAEINASIQRDIWATNLALALAALTVVLGISLSWRQQRLRFMQQELVERQRAEAALRESEERYRLVSENSSDVIWLFDLAAQRFTYVSPSIERLRGFTVAEVQRQQMSEVMTPASFRMVEEMLPARLAAFAGGDDSVRVQTHEIEQTCRDGSGVLTEVVSTLIAGADRRVTHIQGVSRAIAERKAAEEALRRSEQKFASIFQFSPDAIFLASLPDRRFVELNEAVARISGYALEELRGWTTDEIGFWVNAQDKERYQRTLRDAGRIVDFETEFRIKSGARRRCLISAEVIQVEGKPHILSVVRDITERKQAEAELQLQETRLRLALDAAEMVSWELDVPTRRLAYSSNLAALAGSEDLQPYLSMEDFAQQLHPEDRAGVEQSIARTLKAGVPFGCEYRVRVPDGSWHWLAGKGRAVTGADGRVARVLGVSQDITERKRLELARASEHALNQAMIAAVPGAFYTLDAEGGYVRWNAYTRDEIIGKPDDQAAGFHALETVHPEDRAMIASRIAQVFETGAEATMEGRVLLRGGPAFRWMLLTGRRMVLEGRPYLAGFGIDITDRKQAEAALRAREELFSTVFEQAMDAIALVDGATLRFVEFNGAAAEGMGYTREEFAQMTVRDIQADHSPEDFRRNLERLREQGGVVFESHHRHRDGRIRDVRVSIRLVRLQSRELMAAVWSDITEGKQAEVALRDNEQRMRLAVKTTHVGIWEWNLKTNRIHWDAEMFRLYGLPPTDDGFVNYGDWRSAVFAEEVELQESILQDTAQRKGNSSREFRIHRAPDGAVRHIQAVETVRLNPAGDAEWVVGTNFDVTERKQAEDGLRAEQERLASIIFGANVGTWEWNVQTGQTVFNERWAEILGYTLAELAPVSIDTWIRLAHPDDLKASGALLDRHFRGELDHYECEARMRHKNGNWIWVSDRGRVTSWTEDGKPLLMRGTHADITERKQQAGEIVRARDFYLNLLESAPALVWRAGTDAKCDWFNTPWLKFTGRSMEQELGDGWVEGVHPEDLDRCVKHYLGCFHRRESFEMEYRLRHHSGEYRWIVDFGVPIQNLEGEFAGYIGYCYDITERKRAEDCSQCLRDLGLAAAAATHLPEALELCLQAALRISGMESAGIYLLDSQTGALDLNCHAGLSASFFSSVNHLPADSPQVSWARNGRPFHGTLDALGWPAESAERREGLKAVSLLPILHEGHLVAVLNVGSHSLGEVSPPARHGLETIAGLLAGLLGRLRAQEALRQANLELEQRVKDRTQALAASEQRFRAIWQTSRDAILTVDAQGRCLDCNPAAVAVFGCPDRQNLLAARLVDLAPEHQPDGRRSVAVLAEIMARVARQGGGESDWVHQRRDGTLFPAEISIAVAEQDGQPVFHGIVRDVSERKEAEARLRQSEQHFRAIWQTSRDAILTMDARGRWIDCNPAAVAMFGFPDRQSLLGASLESLSPESQPDGRCSREVIAELKPRLAAQGSAAFEWVLQRRDGTAFPTEVSIAVAEQDGQPVFHGIVRDVSERKEAEARLRESEQRHRVLVETIPDWVWEVDAQGRYVFCGPQCRELLGYEPSEIMGQTPFDLMPPEEAQRVAQVAGPLMERGEVLHALENVVRRKDGRLVTLETHGAPVFDADGRVRGYRGVDHDITERKQVSEELRQAKERAEAANRAKSVFLANMSHEIRTPMNAVLGFTQLLLREAGVDSEQHQRLATIMRSGEHLMDIINEILEMARVESGRTMLNPAAFDLRAMLRDLETMFSLRAQAQGSSFSVELDAGVPQVLVADQTKLRQVFSNLLSNAFKFTPVGGRVALRLHATPESAGRVRLKAEVEDTGVGLKPEDAARVFEPFFQTDSGRAAGGTGLGLSISREFAHLMGGDLTVKSQVGSGSCFEFQACLPVAQGDELPDRSPHPPVLRLNRSSAGYPVLVADDSPENRDLLTGLLAPLDFTVCTATNGLEAVEQCETWSPGLVIVDLRMPVMDGFEAARRLRAAHGTALKIMVLSASVADEVRQQSLIAGADAFLGKPVQAAELLECIRQLTGVEYEQSETETAPTGTLGRARVGLPSADAVRRLPVEWLHALRQALAVADYEEMLVLVAKVSTLDELLGGQLRELVESFNYAALDTLVNPN